MLRWALVPYWAKDLKVGFANINAEAEGIENRPAFREAFERRRCLVPVDNFYEWKKTPTGKQPYAIAPIVASRSSKTPTPRADCLGGHPRPLWDHFVRQMGTSAAGGNRAGSVS